MAVSRGNECTWVLFFVEGRQPYAREGASQRGRGDG